MSFYDFLSKNKKWLGAGALLTLSSSYGQTFFISLFAGQIMNDFSLTDGEWGALYAISTAFSAIVMVWAGALTDKYRARSLGVAFLLLLSFTCFLMSFVTSFWFLPIIIFLLRFSGQGMLSHIGSVAMVRWFISSRGKALAIATLGFSFGEAVLPMTVAFLLGVFLLEIYMDCCRYSITYYYTNFIQLAQSRENTKNGFKRF
jgi:MFS family permease